MKRPAAFFPIVLAFGAIILAPRAGAQEQDGREQAPIKIKNCGTINRPGSYVLARNLAASGDCLVITTSFVTIDLAGFNISGSGTGTGIVAPPRSGAQDIAVRNGSISGFAEGLYLLAAKGVIVEGLRISQSSAAGMFIGEGIVRGNVVTNTNSAQDAIHVVGGIVSGNFASLNVGRGFVIEAGRGTSVIGNTATHNGSIGIAVGCPANVTDNTALFNGEGNLQLAGEGCSNTNNVAP